MLQISSPRTLTLKDVFKPKTKLNGTSSYKTSDTVKSQSKNSQMPFIGASKNNNGIVGYVSEH